jgi:hypothetical protein
LDWTVDKIKEDIYATRPVMSKEEVAELISDLFNLLVDSMLMDVNTTSAFSPADGPTSTFANLSSSSSKGAGNNPFIWNGIGFDLPVLAAACPEYRDDLIALAYDLFDPCFQFTRKFGFPIGLSNAAVMTGDSKLDGLDGLEAANLWSSDPGKVMRYCMQDVYLMRKVVQAIMQERKIRW